MEASVKDNRTAGMNIGESDASSSRKTSTVNIEDSKFTVDGIVAEMIIEVDEENIESPAKQLQIPEAINTEEFDSKEAFVHQLGLGNISDLPEVLTVSDSETDTSPKMEDIKERRTRNRSNTPTQRDITKKTDNASRHETSARKVKLGRPSKVKTSDNLPQRTNKTKKAKVALPPPEEKLKLREAKVVLKKLEFPLSSGQGSKIIDSKDKKIENPVSLGQGVKFADVNDINMRVKDPKNKGHLKLLFKLLYDRTPPSGISTLCSQILEFNGFPFTKTSPEFAKRRDILFKLPLNSLRSVCSILNISDAGKRTMIDGMLSLLRKPSKPLDPSKDPKYQPVVIIDKLNYEDLVKIKCEDVGTTPQRRPGRAIKSAKKPLPQSQTKKQPSAQDVSPSTITIGGRNTRNSVSSATELGSLKRKPKTPTPQRKSSPSLWSKGIILPFKKRKLAMSSPPTSTENAIKAEPSSPQRSSPPVVGNQDKKDTGSDIKKIVSTEKKDDARASSSKKFSPAPTLQGKGFDMQRRSADKRRRPSHYGDWIHEETEKRVKLTPKESGVKLVQQVVDMFKDKHPKSKKNIIKKTEKAKTPVVTEVIDEGDDDYDEDVTLIENTDWMEEVDTPPENSLSDEEGTDSATEGKGITINPTTESESTKQKIETEKTSTKAKGAKLRTFPIVEEGMKVITAAALQRLHVILFGTSSNPDVMKRNILDFHGFPFEDNSEEYQQKHFFLSLLASNNISEVFEALHIAPSDSSQTSIVDTLMQFLMAPRMELLDKKAQEFKKAAPPPPKKKVAPAPKGPRHRKVLMDEATYRKLELEIAREQRIRRRADLLAANTLKAMAAATSPRKKVPPNKEEDVQLLFPVSDSNVRIKLGDSPHIQFMIVALSFFDLDILHHLLFLHGASKAKIRRSILEFRGFSFHEISPRYKARLTILKRLGQNMVQRIAFILGLTSMECKKNIHRLAEMVMQFLISPSRMKQVPIKEFPENFIIDCPKEFDKKAIFSDIPDFQLVLQMEFGSTYECEYYVKDLSEKTIQADITQLKKNTMAVSEATIPVAEVVTSDKVNVKEQKMLVKQVNSNQAPLGQMLAVRSGDDNNISYHIIQNPNTPGKLTTPGNTLRMFQKKGGYVLQEVSPSGTKQTLQSFPQGSPPEKSITGPLSQKLAKGLNPEMMQGVARLPQPLTQASSPQRVPLQASPQKVSQSSVMQKLPENENSPSQPSEQHHKDTSQEDESPEVLEVVKPTSNTKRNLQAPNITSSFVIPPKKVVRPPALPPGQAFLLDPAKVKQVMKKTKVGGKSKESSEKKSSESSPTLTPRHRVITKINLSQAIQQKKMSRLTDPLVLKTSQTTPLPKTTPTPPVPKTSQTSPVSKTSQTTPVSKTSQTTPIPKIGQTTPVPKTNSSPMRQLSSPAQSRFSKGKLEDLKMKNLATEEISKSLFKASEKKSPSNKQHLLNEPLYYKDSDSINKTLSPKSINESLSHMKTLSSNITASPTSNKASSSGNKTLLPNILSKSSIKTSSSNITTSSSNIVTSLPKLAPSLSSSSNIPQGILLNNKGQSPNFFFPNTLGTSQPQTILLLQKPGDIPGQQTILVQAPPTLLLPVIPTSTGVPMTSILQPQNPVSAANNSILTLSQPSLSVPSLTHLSTPNQKRTFVEGDKVTVLKVTQPKTPTTEPITQTHSKSGTSGVLSNTADISISSDNNDTSIVEDVQLSEPEVADIWETEVTSLPEESTEPEEIDEEPMIVDGQPTDSLLFEKILDMIHGADLTELTFKNIIEKLSMEYPGLNVAARRSFIKSAVKNIVCGDSG